MPLPYEYIHIRTYTCIYVYIYIYICKYVCIWYSYMIYIHESDIPQSSPVLRLRGSSSKCSRPTEVKNVTWSMLQAIPEAPWRETVGRGLRDWDPTRSIGKSIGWLYGMIGRIMIGRGLGYWSIGVYMDDYILDPIVKRNISMGVDPCLDDSFVFSHFLGRERIYPKWGWWEVAGHFKKAMTW